MHGMGPFNMLKGLLVKTPVGKDNPLEKEPLGSLFVDLTEKLLGLIQAPGIDTVADLLIEAPASWVLCPGLIVIFPPWPITHELMVGPIDLF